MKTLIEILTKEYPVVESHFKSLKASTLVGLFIFIFLYTFQPFQLDTIPTNKALILGGYGTISFAVILIGLTGQRLIAQKTKWFTWEQIVFYILLIPTIAIANFLYTKSYNPSLQIPIIDFVFYTFSVAIFPIAFYVIITQRRLEKKHIQESEEINQELNDLIGSSKTSSTESLTFETTEKEKVTIEQNSILFLESTGNYLVIHYLKESLARSFKTRGTIKDILHELSSSEFLKTHRAFVVNMNHVSKSFGNAQGLKLQLNSHGYEVPVSRNHVSAVKKSLQH